MHLFLCPIFKCKNFFSLRVFTFIDVNFLNVLTVKIKKYINVFVCCAYGCLGKVGYHFSGFYGKGVNIFMPWAHGMSLWEI